MAKKRKVDRYYLIEKILKKQIRNGKVECFIKWLNYSKKFNSWEPKENIKRIVRPDQRKTSSGKFPIKIISRFEYGMYLVKWANGRTSMIPLTTSEAYQVIVNG